MSTYRFARFRGEQTNYVIDVEVPTPTLETWDGVEALLLGDEIDRLRKRRFPVPQDRYERQGIYPPFPESPTETVATEEEALPPDSVAAIPSRDK